MPLRLICLGFCLDGCCRSPSLMDKMECESEDVCPNWKAVGIVIVGSGREVDCWSLDYELWCPVLWDGKVVEWVGVLFEMRSIFGTQCCGWSVKEGQNRHRG